MKYGTEAGLRFIRSSHALRATLAILAFLMADTFPAAAAQDNAPENREDAISFHSRALVNAARFNMNEQQLARFVSEFERTHLSNEFIQTTTSQQRGELIGKILEVIRAAESRETVVSPDWVRVDLFPPEKTYELLFTMAESAPFPIVSMSLTDVTDSRPNYTLTADSIIPTFAQLEESGFSGVIHVRKNGKVLLEKACGMANPELGYPVKFDTVFGIGSTPMDFTLMSIFLLEQRGQLQQSDTLDKFFEDVPADKAKITVRHLIKGESGLPDFFDTEADWDADLAYIDRATAEARIFAQTLLFEPGTDSRSSHGAFGLLASIIERVSGKEYGEFLKENFFDPAGMTRTAMYGNHMGLPLSEFAVGQGPVFFGLPNIPPNWGKTSWLILGSGGMCSTMEDMLKFYALVRSDEVLKPPYNGHFNRFGASLNGSVRGAYLSHAYKGVENEAIVMSNIDADSPREGNLDETIGAFVRALEEFIAE